MEELKVVLHLRDGRALVGIQQQGTDPVLETLEAGTLEAALGAVPGAVQRARECWAQSPRNPAAKVPPAPPPAPPPQRTAQPTHRQEPGPREGAMTPMF